MTEKNNIIYILFIMAIMCFICLHTGIEAKAADPAVTPEPSAEVAAPEPGSSFETTRVTDLRMSGNVKKDEVTILWDDIAYAEYYKDLYKIDSITYEVWKENKLTNGYDILGETGKTSYTIDGLKSGTGFGIMVRAYYVSDNDEKIFCSFSDKLVVGTKPDDIEELIIEGSYSSKVVLSWKSVSDDASYMIYRCSENDKSFEKLASSDVNTYTDTAVSASTGYIYKVYAYIKNTLVINDNPEAGGVEHGADAGEPIRSDNELTVATSTCPAPAKISYTKGGDGRLKAVWSNKIIGDGYIIYIMDAIGIYNEYARVTDISVKEYIITGLVREMEYRCRVVPYRVYEGVEYKSIDESAELILKTTGEVLTSTDAAVYKKVSKLKKSKVMKNYKEFSAAVVYSKNIIMPGLKGANINYFKIDTMVNQAICFAGKYMLISAYDLAGNENSAVYVINSKKMKYVCTIVLPSKHHVGGMAYDGTNIWVSTGKAVSCFAYEDVKAAAASGADSYTLNAYKARCDVASQASFVTFYKNRLWIGEHNERSSVYMYAYKIQGKDSDAPTLTLANKMKIPSRTQDVLFLSSGKMIISRSNQVSAKKSAYYISEMSIYKPGKIKKAGTIKKNSCKGKITMPPMLEGIAYKSGCLYTSYESACISTCPRKLDRICAMKFKKIKWKK